MTFKKTAILFSIVGLAGVLSACGGEEPYQLENKTFTQELTSNFELVNESGVEVKYEIEPLDRAFFFDNHRGHGSMICHPIYHNKNDNRESLSEFKGGEGYYFGSYKFTKVDYSLTGNTTGTIPANSKVQISLTEKFDIAYDLAGSGSSIELFRKLDNVRAKVKVYNTQYPASGNYDYYISDDNFMYIPENCAQEFNSSGEKAEINHYAFADLNISNQLGAADLYGHDDNTKSRYTSYSGQEQQVEKFANGSVLKIQKVYPQKEGKYCVYAGISASECSNFFIDYSGSKWGEIDFKTSSMINNTSADKVLGVVEVK